MAEMEMKFPWMMCFRMIHMLTLICRQRKDIWTRLVRFFFPIKDCMSIDESIGISLLMRCKLQVSTKMMNGKGWVGNSLYCCNIIFHFSFESTVCLSESWRMKCMHKHDVHEHRDADVFLVFEHVCVINLEGWLLCFKHARNIDLGKVDLVSKMEIMMKCFIFWKRVLMVFFYMLDLKGHLF